MTHNHRFYLLICAFAAMLIWGCSATKQAEHAINKAKKKDIALVADSTRKWFPCIVTSKDSILTHDTITKTMRDTVPGKPVIKQLPCPDGSTVTDTCETYYVRVKTDSSFNNYFRITDHVRDMADSTVYAAQLAKKDKQIADNKQWRHFNFTWAIIVSGLLLIAVIVIILLVKRKPS